MGRFDKRFNQARGTNHTGHQPLIDPEKKPDIPPPLMNSLVADAFYTFSAKEEGFDPEGAHLEIDLTDSEPESKYDILKLLLKKDLSKVLYSEDLNLEERKVDYLITPNCRVTAVGLDYIKATITPRGKVSSRYLYTETDKIIHPGTEVKYNIDGVRLHKDHSEFYKTLHDIYILESYKLLREHAPKETL